MPLSKSNKELTFKQNIPLLVKISAIIIIVVSIIDIIFFAGTSIYEVFNKGFLVESNINNSQYPYLDIYVIIQLVLHISLLISAFFLLLLKKIGYYLFIVSLFATQFSEFLFTNEYIFSHIIPGITLGIILTIYHSRYK